MNQCSEIRTELRRITDADRRQGLPLCAEVIAVNGETCTVKDDNGNEYPNVRLKATANSAANYVLTIPKAGSRVQLLDVTGNGDSYLIIGIDEAEKVLYKQGSLTVEINGETGKVQIENGGISLLSLFEDIVDAVDGIEVIAPPGMEGGPCTVIVPPLLDKVKEEAKKILY